MVVEQIFPIECHYLFLLNLTDASLNVEAKELSISGIMQAFPLSAFLNNVIMCQIRPQLSDVF